MICRQNICKRITFAHILRKYIWKQEAACNSITNADS